MQKIQIIFFYSLLSTQMEQLLNSYIDKMKTLEEYHKINLYLQLFINQAVIPPKVLFSHKCIMLLYCYLVYIFVIINQNQRQQMRKGHRRTQSAYIAASNQQLQNPGKGNLNSNEIVKLLEASDSKVSSKVINYERLELSNLQQNHFLKFGNFTLKKANLQVKNNPKIEPQTCQNDLNCIPQNSKSSQISSQKLSKQGGPKQDDIPAPPVRKTKPKRASDFKRLQMEKSQKVGVDVDFSGKRSRFGKSLKKR